MSQKHSVSQGMYANNFLNSNAYLLLQLNFYDIDFPISPGALLEHEPLISSLERQNLPLFKSSLKSHTEDIQNIDQVVLLFYTSENKFNFTKAKIPCQYMN